MKRVTTAPLRVSTARQAATHLRFFRQLIVVLIALLSLSGQARPGPNELYQKRTHSVATVVIGIISYTRWPTEPNPIRLCITANPQYAERLFDPVLLTAPRPIKTALMPINSQFLPGQCDVIYLGNISSSQQQALLHRISGHAILSISENDNECSAGNAFCLQIAGDHASFKVNLDALARSGVHVHPNVLQLARDPELPL